MQDSAFITGPRPVVSVVMPVWNEGNHIDAALDALSAQVYPPGLIEIIVVDGGSGDETLERLRKRSKRDRRIRVMGGPGINTPSAMNIGIEAATGQFIAKIDGHGTTNPEFLQVAVDAMTSDPTLGCIGGRIVPDARSEVERAISIGRFSAFGVGGGVYTRGERVELTDTVQCGVYRREALADIGAFDPALQFGEDEEVNYRLRGAGWNILLDPRMRFTYRVRPSLAALFRQYFRYGRARVAVIRKHPRFLSIKHTVPAMTVVALTGSLPLLLVPTTRVIPLTLWVGYVGFLTVASSILATAKRFPRPDLIAASLASLHIGYGLGTLRGLLDGGRGQRAQTDRAGGRSELR